MMSHFLVINHSLFQILQYPAEFQAFMKVIKYLLLCEVLHDTCSMQFVSQDTLPGRIRRGCVLPDAPSCCSAQHLSALLVLPPWRLKAHSYHSIQRGYWWMPVTRLQLGHDRANPVTLSVYLKWVSGPSEVWVKTAAKKQDLVITPLRTLESPQSFISFLLEALLVKVAACKLTWSLQFLQNLLFLLSGEGKEAWKRKV